MGEWNTLPITTGLSTGIQFPKLSQFLNIFGGMALLPLAIRFVLEMGFLKMMRKLISLEKSTSRKEKPIDEE